MSVLSLPLAKTHLNITVATYDAELQTVIDAAEAAVSQRVGPLTPTAVTSRVNARPSNSGTTPVVVSLPVTPVISITSITAVIAGATYAPTDVIVDPDYGIVRLSSGLDMTVGIYDVAYQAGWSTVPNDLLFLIKEQTREMWETQRGATLIPGTTSTRPAANVEALIAPFDHDIGFA